MEEIREEFDQEELEYYARRRKRRTRRNAIIAVVLVILLAGGGLFTYAYMQVRSLEKNYPHEIYANVSIDGIDVGGLSKEKATETIQNAAEKAMKTNVSLKAGKQIESVRLKRFAPTYDIDKAVDKAYKTGREGGFIHRFLTARKLHKETIDVDLEVTVDEKNIRKVIRSKTDTFSKEPQNAYPMMNTTTDKEGVEKTEVVIVPEEKGQAVATAKAIPIVQKALDRHWNEETPTIKLPIITEKPTITRADLKDITDVLGTFTTDFDYDYVSRRLNIENGTRKINGTLIQPGDNFSVYEKVAPFSAANGYYLANTYSGKKVIQDYGGGICQVSTTLYNAAIRAELEITERHCHGMTIHYVPLSADAAISGQTEDLKFTNNLDYPIYISGSNGHGTITFTIFGKETRPSNRRVEFISVTTGVYPPKEKVTEDPNMEEGEREITEHGATGYSAQLWKVIYVDGKEESRTQFNSSNYRSVPREVTVGTKKKEEEKKDKKKKKQSGAQKQEQKKQSDDSKKKDTE